jgi:hypothetical protein
MTNLVETLNNINKRLNGLVSRTTRRAVKVNNKPNYVKPTKNACHSEFGTSEKLKNTLQALQIANSKNDRDKFKRAKDCMSYNNIGNTGQQLLLENAKEKNTSESIIKRNNRNTVANKPGNNTKKNGNGTANANAKGYYKVLGFNPPFNSISANAIKNSYKKLIKEAHPNMQQKKGLTVDPELFKRLQEAFEYLKDPDNRSVYNGKKTLKNLTNDKLLLLKNNNVNAKHWTKYSDEKDTWYTNKKEPISVWEKNLPKNAIIDETPPEFWIVGESQDKSWLKLKDDYDHTYFYNKADDITSWESPEGIEIKDLAVRKRITNINIQLPDPPKNATKNATNNSR